MKTSSAASAKSPWFVLLATSVGLIMLMVDMFVVTVALPAIARDFKAELGLAQWTVSIYALALGVLPLAMGRLGDIFGRRKVYLAGLLVFVIGSIAAGLAQDIFQLIAYRAVQGVGAAIMFPGTLSIVTQAFPPQRRGLAIGVWGGVSGIGLLIGPVIGGLLVSIEGWRWIFFVNVPVGALALAVALVYIPESRDEGAPRTVDWPGAALLSLGLLLLMLGVAQANSLGWTSPFIIDCFGVGAAVLFAFVRVERRAQAPLVDLGLFRNGMFVMACVTGFLFFAGVFGGLPYISLFMQNYWGFTPLEAGLAFLAATLPVTFSMPLAGMFAQRLGPWLRLLIVAGTLAIVLASLNVVFRLDTGSTYAALLLPSFVLQGLGIGVVISVTSFAAVSALPTAKSGLAAGTFIMARQIGTAVGVAVLGAVFLQYVDVVLPDRLADGPHSEIEPVVLAAKQFIAIGDGEALAAVRQVIAEGLSRVFLVTALAAVAAFFIRHRLQAD